MKTILITRPATQAHELAQYLRPFGIDSIIFPVLDIQAPKNPTTVKKVAEQESAYDDFVFVSPISVGQFGLLTGNLIPTHPRIITMGAGTTQALAQLGIGANIIPVIANSKELLKLPELQNVAQRKIAIFTGEAGNTTLQETLAKRGALVTMAYTHRRALPHYEQPLEWDPQNIDASVVTSGESLANFVQLIEQLHLNELYEKPLIVITLAMQQQAQQNGFKSAIILASDAHHASILAAVRNGND
jgi:uroporphyrinogen-III synthase